jgi:putative CocE/NonD family hydrolase
MDHYLRGINNGIEREAPVRIFVMSANAWRDEQAWPLARAKSQSLYLAAATSDARVGTLLQQPAQSKASTSELRSDPAHPVSDAYNRYGAHDYRALAGREDVLTFDSEPLSADTEVTGPIKLEVFVSADVPDFDLWGRLLDVAPDGTAYNLMSPGLDVLRASYRNESLQPDLLIPGQVYKLELDRMLTSNTFLKGHKIRVQISSAFFPHLSRNLQTEKSEIVSSASQIGHLTIYHDAEHPSRIILPIVK